MLHRSHDSERAACERATLDSAGCSKRLELESGALPVRLNTVQKLQRALEAAGIAFIEQNGGGPGVRLRERRR
jgi:hypothetical protein